jgi:TonB-dependent starch-binding outer membrane protein SusC
MLKKQKAKSAAFTTEKKVSLLVFFLFASSFLFAQQKIIVAGKVFTEKNTPLAGVSVNVKESSAGTTTDADGKFSIQVIKGATIVLSFVGYEEKTVKVSNDKSAASIQMVSTTSSLGEVVVVGYGKQKKVNLTGSFATLNNKDLKTIPSSNMVTGLAGKLPGLRVTQQTGEPGSYNSLFDIRGFGTPLIVVDGLVTDEGTFVRL